MRPLLPHKLTYQDTQFVQYFHTPRASFTLGVLDGRCFEPRPRGLVSSRPQPPFGAVSLKTFEADEVDSFCYIWLFEKAG